MELTFPFKNIAFNTLLEFTEKDFLVDFFIKVMFKKDAYYQGFVNNRVEMYKNTLPNFENEILQIVNTTNQETIDYYFNELKGNLKYVENIDNYGISKTIEEFNIESYDKFIKKTSQEVDIFQSKPERKRYKHLERYEEQGFTFPDLFSQSPILFAKKIPKINYNIYCIEEIPEIIDLQYFPTYINLLNELTDILTTIAEPYVQQFDDHEFKVNPEQFFKKIIVYLEGEQDIKYINKAAELLEISDILYKIELRQLGGYANIDKVWNFYKNNNVELIPTKKIFLYDCDIQRNDEDFGMLHKRIIPKFKENKIQKGIENLFNDNTIEKAKKHKSAFIDHYTQKGSRRGVEYENHSHNINEDEKTNLCDWLCEYGTKEDFINFKAIFRIFETIINIENIKH